MIREKENGNMNNLNDFLKLYFNLKDEDTESIASLFTEETLHRNDYFLHNDKVCKKTVIYQKRDTSHIFVGGWKRSNPMNCNRWIFYLGPGKFRIIYPCPVEYTSL